MKRNYLRQESKYKYITFVDDDDRVPSDYKPSILTKIYIFMKILRKLWNQFSFLFLWIGLIIILLLMAISCKKKQAIDFCPKPDNGCVYADFFQSYCAGDTMSFQVNLDELDGEELITNGDFSSGSGWTTGAGWSIAAGLATSAGGLGSLSSNDAPLVVGEYYRMTFTVTTFTSGTLQTEIGRVTADEGIGTYSGVFLAVATDIFFDNLPTWTGSIDNVSVKRISQVGIRIQDCDDFTTAWEEYDNASGYIEYYAPDPATIVVTENANKGQAQIDIPVSDLGIANDCYFICLVDIMESLYADLLPEFRFIDSNATATAANKLIDNTQVFTGLRVNDTSAQNITVDNDTEITAVDTAIQLSVADDIFLITENYRIQDGWLLENGLNKPLLGWGIQATGWFQAAALPAAPGSTVIVRLLQPLDPLKTYTLDFTILNQTVDGLALRYDTATLADQHIGFFNNGNHSVTLTGIAITRLKWFVAAINGDDPSGASSILEDVMLTEDNETLDCEVQSPCLSIGADCGNKRPNLKLTYNNDENFLLPNGDYLDYEYFVFEQTLNLPARLKDPRYDDTIYESYMFSTGDRTTTVKESVKVWLMGVAPIPSHVLDALRIALMHDNLFIDGVRYHEFSAPESEYVVGSDKSNVTVEVIEEGEINRNG